MGYLPHALINYLARLGWAYGDQEIFTIDELIERFSLENVGKASGVFNPEKLSWLNAHYIKSTEPAELAPLLVPFLTERGVRSGVRREAPEDYRNPSGAGNDAGRDG